MDRHSKLNLRGLLLAGPSRLRYVYHFSGVPVLRQISVAEHSFMVAFIAMALGREIETTHEAIEENFNEGLLLRKALLHDLEEAISGDFPRPFKHGSGPEVKAALDKAAYVAAQQVFGAFHDDPSEVLHYCHTWKYAKDSTLEGRTVRVADFLAVAAYLYEERQRSGNLLDEVAESFTPDRVQKEFSGEEFSFFRPWLQDMADIWEEACPPTKA